MDENGGWWRSSRLSATSSFYPLCNLEPVLEVSDGQKVLFLHHGCSSRDDSTRVVVATQDTQIKTRVVRQVTCKWSNQSPAILSSEVIANIANYSWQLKLSQPNLPRLVQKKK